MTPEERNDRTAHRRQEILAEATNLFAAEGYARTKVDDIALRLSVAKGTIYRYFPTKEQLFLAVADKAMENLQTAMHTATGGIDDPFKRIAAAVEGYLSFFDANLHLIEILVHERAEFRDRKKPTCLTYRDRNIKNLEALLAGMKEAGLARDIDVVRTAAILGDLLYGTVYTHFLRGGRRNLKKLAPQIVDVYFNGILSTAGKRTRSSPRSKNPVPTRKARRT